MSGWSRIIKFSDTLFTLNNGETCPFYINIKGILNVPDLLQDTVDVIMEEIDNYVNGPFIIAGVPLGGALLAASLLHKIRKDYENAEFMILRKEAKSHGQQKQIECESKDRDKTVFLIEDVITTGHSVLSAIRSLKSEGYNDIVVIGVLDRQQGGVNRLEYLGIEVITIYTLDYILQFLSDKCKQIITNYIKDNLHIDWNLSEDKAFIRNGVTFQQRLLECKKKCPVIVSLDISDEHDFFVVLSKIQSKISILKVHLDIFNEFNYEDLIQRKQKYGFMILEDRKYNDACSIVVKQWNATPIKYADCVTVMSTVHPNVYEQLHKAGCEGIFVVTDTSYSDYSDLNFTDNNYVSGYITQSPSKLQTNKLKLMPGIHLDAITDNLDQHYRTPQKAKEFGADFIIVGRGIYKADDPEKALDDYIINFS